MPRRNCFFRWYKSRVPASGNLVDLQRGDYEEMEPTWPAAQDCSPSAAYRVSRAEDNRPRPSPVRSATAVSGRPGGVYLDISRPAVLGEVIDRGEGGGHNCGASSTRHHVRLAPKRRRSTSAIDLLANAKTALDRASGKGAAYAQGGTKQITRIRRDHRGCRNLADVDGEGPACPTTTRSRRRTARSLALKPGPTW